MFKILCIFILFSSFLVVPYVMWQDYINSKNTKEQHVDEKMAVKSQLYG